MFKNKFNLSVMFTVVMSIFLPQISVNAQSSGALSNPVKSKSTTASKTSPENPTVSSSAVNTTSGTRNSNSVVTSNTTTQTTVSSNVPYDTMINGVKYRKKHYKQQYPAQYRYEYIDQYRYTNYALGIDYTNESFLKNVGENNATDLPMSWDSLGQLQNSSGVNIYFIGKLHPEKFMPFGRFNWGIDMGFSHFRRGEKSNVELGTINKDSGFTRLETMAFNMSGMLRYEFAMGRIYPFIGLHGGFAVYSTDQYTQSYINLVDYETSGSVDVRNSATLFVSPEIGVRIRVAPAVSIVASYERRFGNTVNVTDITRTQFNGLAYNEKSNTVNYNTETFKLGFLFDLGGHERERKQIAPARDTTIAYLEAVNENTQTNTQTTHYQQNTINNPCPCPCPPTNSVTPSIPNQGSTIKGSTIQTQSGNSAVGTPGTSNNTTSNGSSINVTGSSFGIGSSKSKVDSPVSTGGAINTTQPSTTTNKTSSGANILIYGGSNSTGSGSTSSGNSSTGVIVKPGSSIKTGTGSGISIPKGTAIKPPVKAFPGISTPPVTIKKPKS